MIALSLCKGHSSKSFYSSYWDSVSIFSNFLSYLWSISCYCSYKSFTSFSFSFWRFSFSFQSYSFSFERFSIYFLRSTSVFKSLETSDKFSSNYYFLAHSSFMLYIYTVSLFFYFSRYSYNVNMFRDSTIICDIVLESAYLYFSHISFKFFFRCTNLWIDFSRSYKILFSLSKI